jgi:phosphoribosylglycinamide formyltransferase-1
VSSFSTENGEENTSLAVWSTNPSDMAAEERLAIFMSGTGTNALRIIEHFRDHPNIRVNALVTNRSDSGAVKMGLDEKIGIAIISRSELQDGTKLMKFLKDKEITCIVLAGFLWLIPEWLIRAFPSRIVNIHPSLLPKYGGKGMYGQHVHRAVLEAGDPQSGITIHYVNEAYDEGAVIFQASCPVMPDDTPQTLAARVLQLEHAHFPSVIEEILTKPDENLSLGE